MTIHGETCVYKYLNAVKLNEEEELVNMLQGRIICSTGMKCEKEEIWNEYQGKCPKNSLREW